jgi:hypothetical protein
MLMASMHRDDRHTPPPRAVAAARPAPTEPTSALRLALLVSLLLLLLVLACGNASVFGTTSRQPYVTCPTPTPQPFGVAGPRKPGCICPNGTTECPACWYAEWEQEGGPPTPLQQYRQYFAFDEPVTIEPFTVRVHVGYNWLPGVPAGQQLAIVGITWGNPTQPLTASQPVTATTPVTPTMAPAGAVSITYETALQITEVEDNHGQWHHGAWTVDDQALALHPLPLPDTIPQGDALHVIPILIPDGQVQRLHLALPYLGPPDGTPEADVVLRFTGQVSPICP